MNYLSLKEGYLLTIMMPLSLIISKTIMFLHLYIKNNYVKKTFNFLIIVFAIISTLIFYVLNWGNYFCFIWLAVIIVSVIQYNLIYRKKGKIDTDSINILEKILIAGSISWGVFILILPYTKIFTFIGGGTNKRIDILSKIIFFVYGMCQLLLDKHTIFFVKNRSTLK